MTDIQILDMIEEYIKANNELIETYSHGIQDLLDNEFDDTTAERLHILRDQRGNFIQRKSVLEMLYDEICYEIDNELQNMEV